MIKKYFQIGLFFKVIIILLLTILACEGMDIDVSVPEGNNQNGVESPKSSQHFGEEWINVYFTSPKEKDDGDHQGGIDVHLIRAIEEAQEKIDLALFETDLESVNEALLAAVNRGVKIRMVVDSENWEDDEEMYALLKKLKQAGVPIVGDERSAFMHNKFVIFDDELVLTGSWNVTHNGTYRNNNNAVYIQSSELAKNYTTEFNEMFEKELFGMRSPSDTPHPILTIQGTRLETYFAPEDKVADRIVAELKKAKNNIRFMAFSFTEDSIGEAVIEQAKNGVDVQGIFEKRGSETKYSEFGRMKKKKLNVLQDGNRYILHHKTFIIDDEIVITGSFNFSKNANKNNDENILIIDNKKIAGMFVAEFTKLYDLAKSAK
ncbi:MAG: hypothetical protein B6242_08785 [Anaerolineaceae bacterium 4572_78]|nr:MAG: hypothetical protein B6242_08785 [Anaerolineaceae bacterium 4572_78]